MALDDGLKGQAVYHLLHFFFVPSISESALPNFYHQSWFNLLHVSHHTRTNWSRGQV